jgi:hypothetical protein
MESILEEASLIFRNKTLMMARIMNKAVRAEINLIVILILLILIKEKEEERKVLKQKNLEEKIRVDQKPKLRQKNSKKIKNKLKKMMRKTKL